MIFTLVKNELIKVLKRGKTWVVFGLFALAMIGFIFIAKMEAKNMTYQQSPQGQIEILNSSLDWKKDDLKHNEEYLKEIENNKSVNKSEIEQIKESIKYTKEDIKSIENDIKEQEKLLVKGKSDWKVTLKASNDNLKKNLEEAKLTNSDKEYIYNLSSQIKKNNYFLDNNIEPIQDWGFYPSNIGIKIMKIFGMIMLAAGIAVFMSDIVSGECTPATLKFLLVQPISRSKVILSKFIAIVITVVGMICGLEVVAFGVIGAITGFDAAKMPIELGLKYKLNEQALINGYRQLEVVKDSGYNSTMGNYVLESFLLQVLFIVACCAFIFMISALFKSTMITMAVSVIVSVAATALSMMSGKIGEYAHLIFLNYGNTPDVIEGSIATTYINPNFTPQLGVSLMVGTIIVSYIIANIVFSRRDMLV